MMSESLYRFGKEHDGQYITEHDAVFNVIACKAAFPVLLFFRIGGVGFHGLIHHLDNITADRLIAFIAICCGQ